MTVQSSTGRQPLKIGRYIVSRWLGGGLQGKVFLAFDPDLERQVAIKWLNAPGGEKSPATRLAYPSEARIVAKLEHPNIVPLYDAGTHRNRPYLVFAYVAGTTLREKRIQTGTMPAGQALPLFRAIVEGMANAHAQGILHLDLAPGNIMIDSAGVPRIMDFGLAKLVGADAPDADEDSLVGTPQYMSPEHFKGQPLSSRSDVFALGLILFEMLVGRSPMQAQNLEELVAAISDHELDLSLLARMDLPTELTLLLSRSLANDPQKRYPDAVAMKQALDQLAGTTSAASHSTVDFLLNRMKRKANFPALSNNLLEINRMTAEDARSSVDSIAQVVLRDFAITNKLLKLANSSYYGRAGQGVRTVSEAIHLLGMDVIRTTCNGLAFFKGMQDGDRVLKDALISSFSSALIGRHCALRIHRKELAEEAFICGMFHRLGRNLAIYYFGDEFHEIEDLVASTAIAEETAASHVLGIGYAELGMAVAASWNFPATIQQSIQTLAPGPLQLPENPLEIQRQMAAFGNELCELAARCNAANGFDRLEAHAARFSSLMQTSPASLVELLQSVFDKLTEFAPVLGLQLKGSVFIGKVRDFLDAMRPLVEKEPLPANVAAAM